jgi:hypothetical protein
VLPEACFVIHVIEDCDWDEPLLTLHVVTENQLTQAIEEAIDYVVKFIKENPDRPIRDTALG